MGVRDDECTIALAENSSLTLEEGNVVVSQSGTTTELTSESPALQFSTLPSAIIQEETGFSLTQNDLISSFYNWSLND